jgi:hypothetical protein
MEQLSVASVLPTGPTFLERVRALPSRIQEVVTHGVFNGAALALAAAHLHSDVGLACGGAEVPTGATGPKGFIGFGSKFLFLVRLKGLSF